MRDGIRETEALVDTVIDGDVEHRGVRSEHAGRGRLSYGGGCTHGHMNENQEQNSNVHVHLLEAVVPIVISNGRRLLAHVLL